MARQRLKLGLVLGCMVAGLLGGCGVKQKDFNALKQENEDLRTKVATIEMERNTAVARATELEQQQSQTITQANGGPGVKTRAPTTKGGNVVVLEIAGDVLFDPGQATVKSTAKKELDRIASQLNNKYSGHDIRVEGHTDSDPPKKMKARFPTNEALSEARAQAVKEYLTSKGVSARRVSTIGYGDSRPKATKKDSRRVDIVVLAE